MHVLMALANCAPALPLQVLVNDTWPWGGVRGFGPPGDMEAASVACRELGVSNKGSVFVSLFYNLSEPNSGLPWRSGRLVLAPIFWRPGEWISNVTCTGAQTGASAPGEGCMPQPTHSPAVCTCGGWPGQQQLLHLALLRHSSAQARRRGCKSVTF